MTAAAPDKKSTRHRRSEILRALKAKAWLGLAVLPLLGVLGLAAVASADTTISQGYTTTDKLPMGSVVSLIKNSQDEVSATSSSNADSIIGVVITNGSSLLSLSNGQGSQVQVATSGVVQTLVSDINGSITQGDDITASPISGVGMKATANAKVVGIAQAGLTSGNSSTESYTDKTGKHTVRIGLIPVLVSVAYYFKQPNKTVIPAAIQNIANALAGKTVNTLPILLCIGIFIITLVVVASIVYSMIHGSIISVGRNPMSQSAIYRNLTQMSALVVGILAVAVVAIYLILTKL
ncbi:MAG TPA: hypothetical protein VF261_00745 [Candidatus Saccharimonadales bacterium]